jgi:hypothetical protein
MTAWNKIAEPTRAELPCSKIHYWCRQHAGEVCAQSPSIKVKHAECKLIVLKGRERK